MRVRGSFSLLLRVGRGSERVSGLGYVVRSSAAGSFEDDRPAVAASGSRREGAGRPLAIGVLCCAFELTPGQGGPEAPKAWGWGAQ